MKILVIQNCETEGIGFYEEFLKEKRIAYETIHPYINGKFPGSGEYDALIIGGTPISVSKIDEYEFLKSEFHYIENAIKEKKPCLGICFGAQLLAKILGAEVRKNPIMEIGGYEIKLTLAGKKDTFFRGFPAKFPVFHWHADTFDIPKGAALLAEGIDCKNQAFRSGNSLALQFHLEIGSDEAAKWADQYADELSIVRKTKTQVIAECRATEKVMQKIAFLLMDNFAYPASNGSRWR